MKPWCEHPGRYSGVLSFLPGIHLPSEQLLNINFRDAKRLAQGSEAEKREQGVHQVPPESQEGARHPMAT